MQHFSYSFYTHTCTIAFKNPFFVQPMNTVCCFATNRWTRRRCIQVFFWPIYDHPSDTACHARVTAFNAKCTYVRHALVYMSRIFTNGYDLWAPRCAKAPCNIILAILIASMSRIRRANVFSQFVKIVNCQPCFIGFWHNIHNVILGS